MKSWSANEMHYGGEYAGDNMMIRGASTGSSYEFISYSRTPEGIFLSVFFIGSLCCCIKYSCKLLSTY
ncbi:hypothetical protein AGMMS49574_27030 [Bacteroidia bacterium]|nr:hypothetical protein AGMMS49574_27030 [Bacteroidia bacterium]